MDWTTDGMMTMRGTRKSKTMTRLALLPLLAVVLASAATAQKPGARRSSPAPAETPAASRTAAEIKADLATEVQRLIDATRLRKAVIAVSVRDAEGRVVVDVQGDRAMLPASNMKLVTTGVALRTLGSDFSFRTRLLSDGRRLTVVGDGDPAFGDPELLETLAFIDTDGRERTGMSVETLLDRWVDAVVASGVKRFDELVVDDRVFEREFFHPMWPKDQLNERYCAEVSGLNFHLNRLHLYPRPGGGGADLSRMEPSAPFLEIRDRTTSKRGKKDSNTLWVSRSPERNDFALNGNLKEASGVPIPVVVHDMPSIFGEILAHRLRRAGVEVGRVRRAETSDPPPSGAPIGPVVRTPISVAIERANTDSQNLYAEALLKRSAAQSTGKPGSWALGAELAQRSLRECLGDDGAPFVCSDGSGLSRGNRVSANGMSAWVDCLSRDPEVGSAFLDSLAIGGQSGTVQRRFRELDPAKALVRCKTGYIAGVSTLSGIVESGGERWTFSVLGNDLTEGSAVAKVRQLQEQVVRAIVRRMPAPSAAVSMERSK